MTGLIPLRGDDMRILLISDIHGNLEALESCFEAADKERVDSVKVLGDIVGYMANPNECVERVKEYDCICGNHDNAVYRDEELKYFNLHAAGAILWTRKHIRREYIDFLSSLLNNRVYPKENYTIAHGSLINPLEYIEYEYQVERNAQISATPLVFVGHTHVPAMWRVSEDDSAECDTGFRANALDLEFHKEIELEDGKKYLINIGSVGQPRDRNPKGCCVIYDSDRYTVKYLRFQYSVEKTVEKIKANNLPEFLHKRLLRGE